MPAPCRGRPGPVPVLLEVQGPHGDPSRPGTGRTSPCRRSQGNMRTPPRPRRARPSATRPSATRRARAGWSGHPQVCARRRAGTGPRRNAATSRPRPWRSEPSKRSWRTARRAGSTAPSDAPRHAQQRARGQRAQAGWRAVQRVAPISMSAWFHTQPRARRHQGARQLLRRRRSERGTGHGPGQDASHVHVDHGDVALEGEGQHGPGGVRARPRGAPRGRRARRARRRRGARRSPGRPRGGCAPGGCSRGPPRPARTSPDTGTGAGVGRGEPLQEAAVGVRRRARPGSAGA